MIEYPKSIFSDFLDEFGIICIGFVVTHVDRIGRTKRVGIGRTKRVGIKRTKGVGIKRTKGVGIGRILGLNLSIFYHEKKRFFNKIMLSE